MACNLVQLLFVDSALSSISTAVFFVCRTFHRNIMPLIAGNQEVPSTFSFDSVEDVKVVEFCPFDSATGVIAYGGDNRVAVGVCLFQEEAQDSHLPELQFQHITDFHHGTSVHALAWSPKTNIQHLPYSFQ